MQIGAKVLKDSLAPGGERLTTVEATGPRFILAELNTSRLFSRNSASSRAIPTWKLLQRVRENPVLPVYWGRNQAGMQAQCELDEEEIDEARDHILYGSREMADLVETLGSVGLHKQSANRYIEPWMWHTVIVSATEWENFFAQRDTWPDPSQPPGPAQPEFAVLARCIREALDASTPRQLKAGEWHLPLVETEDKNDPLYVSRDEATELSTRRSGMVHVLAAISAARCARISYLTHDGIRDISEDMALHDRLVENRHPSPLEHPAQAMPAQSKLDEDLIQRIDQHTGTRLKELAIKGLSAERWSGNFHGWRQYRKFFANEHVGRAPGDI